MTHLDQLYDPTWTSCMTHLDQLYDPVDMSHLHVSRLYDAPHDDEEHPPTREGCRGHRSRCLGVSGGIGVGVRGCLGVSGCTREPRTWNMLAVLWDVLSTGTHGMLPVPVLMGCYRYQYSQDVTGTGTHGMLPVPVLTGHYRCRYSQGVTSTGTHRTLPVPVLTGCYRYRYSRGHG